VRSITRRTIAFSRFLSCAGESAWLNTTYIAFSSAAAAAISSTLPAPA
jgi:hypothetical protein